MRWFAVCLVSCSTLLPSWAEEAADGCERWKVASLRLGSTLREAEGLLGESFIYRSYLKHSSASPWRQKQRGRGWRYFGPYLRSPRQKHYAMVLPCCRDSNARLLAINALYKHYGAPTGLPPQQYIARWGQPDLRDVPIEDTKYYRLFGFKGAREDWTAFEWIDQSCEVTVTMFYDNRGKWGTGLGREYTYVRIAMYPDSDLPEE
ncbi:MAG: hypothetical protein ACYS7M_08915 [Planctomycetota bacterium]